MGCPGESPAETGGRTQGPLCLGHGMQHTMIFAARVRSTPAKAFCRQDEVSHAGGGGEAPSAERQMHWHMPDIRLDVLPHLAGCSCASLRTNCGEQSGGMLHPLPKDLWLGTAAASAALAASKVAAGAV